jgi:predicted nuclease of predicted toxin-antitoxin system
VKLLVDAQLPRRLARELVEAGHDARHTLDLPRGNRTPDDEIIRVATQEARIVMTKDRDFVVSFWLRRHPARLLLISTGNLSNDALSRLIAVNLPGLEAAFAQHDFVELGSQAITIHV